MQILSRLLIQASTLSIAHFLLIMDLIFLQDCDIDWSCIQRIMFLFFHFLPKFLWMVILDCRFTS